MDENPYFPVFDETDCALFSIPNARARADALQSVVVPKLRSVLGAACELIAEVYGPNSLDGSREATSPAHRKMGVKKTRLFEAASAGIRHRCRHYFMLSFRSDDNGLGVQLEANRSSEANPFVDILRKHEDKVVELLDDSESLLLWPDCPEDISDVRSMIRAFSIPDHVNSAHTELFARPFTYPIDDIDKLWDIVYDFVALFPIYQAVGEVFAGTEERFEDYYQQFQNWVRSNENEAPTRDDSRDATSRESSSVLSTRDSPFEPTISPAFGGEVVAVEGAVKESLRRHRSREKRLRKAKIRVTLKRCGGRLRCEVPGCGFDFAEVYGELGVEFAHVHHLNPLGDLSAPSETRLSDLAIVCANCHAMIHRGSTTRPLDGIIKNPRLNASGV